MKHILPIHTILNRNYKIISVLGEGGFALTYKVEHLYLNELRVVKEFFLSGKCVRAHDTQSLETQGLSQEDFEKFKERFVAEANMLSKLKNIPHTIPVVDFFEENNTAYIVLPFVEAQDLGKYMATKSEKRLNETETLAIFTQIATALQQIHAAKVIHRDIKPANILIGNQGEAYLIDFGAAREFIAEGISQTMTAILTPGYAPWEQYDEHAKRGATMDIYALGALLYRMTTGKVPPNAPSRNSQNLVPPKDLQPQLSQALSDAIVKALEMKPQDRFPSVEAMQKAINQRTQLEPPALNLHEEDWKTATQQDTIGAYRTFVHKYPTSTYLHIAEKSIQELTPSEKTKTPEEWHWEKASLAHTLAAYQVFVQKYPQSGLRSEADRRIATLQEGKPSPVWAFGQKYLWYVFGVLVLLTVVFKIVREKQVADSISEFVPMIAVQGGTFQMGSNDGEDDEKPVHAVSLSSYYIGRTEVTQAQWREIMGKDPEELYNKGCDNCPVENVSWNDIQVFLQKLNEKYPNKNYRLPTEAEWEYAARGGTSSKGYTYAGNNNLWLVGHYNSEATQAVGQLSPNELGIYDMSGNVWEWCQDIHDAYNTIKIHPFHVFRGGSWYSNASYCRVANRGSISPDYRNYNIGFRLSRTN